LSNILISLYAVAFCGYLTYVSLFRSNQVQKKALDYYQKHPEKAKFNPFLNWMKTSSYIGSLKISGILSLLMLVISLVALIASVVSNFRK